MSSPRPTVLFLSSVRFFSGAEIALLESLRDNHSIEIVLIAPNSELLQRAKAMGIRTRTSFGLGELDRRGRGLWPFEFAARMLISFVEIVTALGQEKPDLIHVNNFAGALYAIAPALLLRAPLIWHIHDIFPATSFEARVIRRLSRFVSRILVPSAAAKHEIQAMGVGEKVTTVHYGLDVEERFNPGAYEGGALRNSIGIPRDSLLVGMCSQIVEHKGPQVFLDAIELLEQQHSDDVRYVLVGSAPRHARAFAKQVEERIRTSPALSSRVYLAGWRNDIPQVLRDLDVVVVPSVFPDPFPTTVLQAMAMQKAVIASAIGGIPEMVDDGKNGFLVEPGNALALSERLGSLLSTPELVSTIGKKARAKVEARFTEELEQKAMLDIYREAVSG